MLPSLLYSIVGYYILDLEKESFVVFFPTWFVPYRWDIKLT